MAVACVRITALNGWMDAEMDGWTDGYGGKLLARLEIHATQNTIIYSRVIGSEASQSS